MLLTKPIWKTHLFQSQLSLSLRQKKLFNLSPTNLPRLKRPV